MGRKVQALLSMLPNDQLPLMQAYGASTTAQPFEAVAAAAQTAGLGNPAHWQVAAGMMVDELNAAVLRRVTGQAA
jgi:hypothetical protein